MLKKFKFASIGDSRFLFTDVFVLNEVGDYEFIPYIKVVQEGLPSGLISAITGGEGYTWAEYAMIPFKRDNMRFSVVNRKIEGSVTLLGSDRPSDVYVWFESMNLAVSTTFNGNFELVLPPRPEQPGGGLDGEYDLYCYLGNYGLRKVPVHFVNGGTEPGSTVEVTLAKMLDIRTFVADSVASHDDSLDIEFHLSAVTAPVDAELVLGEDDVMNGVFIVGEDSVAHIVHDPLYPMQTVKSISTEEIYGLRWKIPATLNPGVRYRVVPFIFVAQEDLPELMIGNFGPFSRWLHADYLNIPFKRQDAYFVLE
jgi:hypothetical protein